jgi:hypothetical protein
MSDSKLLRGATPRAVRRESNESADFGGTRNWLERAPQRPPPRVPADPAAPHRHAAITRSLYSYANYKSWADKVRTSWDPDKDPSG